MNTPADIQGPAPKPCESCPYRRDVPSGIWSAREYEALLPYDGPTWSQPLGLFQCHQTERESDRTRLCAGWVAVHGAELLALRVAVAQGWLPVGVFDYETRVELFATAGEAAEHGVRDIDDPGEAANAMIDKISRARSDVRFG